MKRRSAASLIELLVVITGLAMILTMIAGLLRTALRSNDRARDQLVSSVTQSRLAAAFRRDVSAALPVRDEPGEGGRRTRLHLVLPGGSVEYRAMGNSIVRVDRDGETVRSRDEFSMGQRSTAWFEFEAGATDRQSIILNIETGAKEPSAPSRRVRVWATLAKDHRFSGGERP